MMSSAISTKPYLSMCAITSRKLGSCCCFLRGICLGSAHCAVQISDARPFSHSIVIPVKRRGLT